MEWLLLALAVGGGSAYAASKVSTLRRDRKQRAEELEQVRHLADEDVTVFGEQLQRLGDSVAEQSLDTQTRADYQTALDAYERAKWDAPRLQQADEISRLVDTLASGRYALACVRARVAGEPVPELRVPCFFNPQHGPSARNVMWTSARTGTRTVPACQRCAAQLAAREKPEVRTVQIGSRKVPYWEAGVALEPYARGYFPADVVAVAWLFAPPDSTPYTDFGGHGYHGGGDFGELDFGGFDGGGGGGDGGGGGT